MGGYGQKWLTPFRSYGTLKWGGLTNNLMNWADWLNDFCFGLTTSLLYIFDICWVTTTIVLVKNDMLSVVPTGKVLELGFPEFFFNKSLIKYEKVFSVWKNMGSDQKPRCSFCMAIEPHKFKILAFLLYGYHSPQLKNIAIPSIAFSPHRFQLLPTC